MVDYDLRWPAEVDRERARLLIHIPWITAIEHAGSTAVPGLVAKPIIDLFAAVDDLSDVDTGQAAVESLVYRRVEDPTLSELLVERRYFRRRTGTRETHRLHVFAPASFFERGELVFRDHLRRHPDIAQRYGALKREWWTALAGDIGTWKPRRSSYEAWWAKPSEREPTHSFYEPEFAGQTPDRKGSPLRHWR